MIYMKSALAGVLAVVAAAILTVGVVTIRLSIASRSTESGVVGWDPISVANPMTWLVVVGIFSGGFLWEFLRASAK
jgi:hypothetical protein